MGTEDRVDCQSIQWTTPDVAVGVRVAVWPACGGKGVAVDVAVAAL